MKSTTSSTPRETKTTSIPLFQKSLPRPAQETLGSIAPPMANAPLPGATPNEATQTRKAGTSVRIETTKEQLLMTLQLFEDSNETLPLSEFCAGTRLSKPTVCRPLKRLRNGDNITKKPKRCRKPKILSSFLKRLSTDLCFHNVTIRLAQAELS